MKADQLELFLRLRSVLPANEGQLSRLELSTVIAEAGVDGALLVKALKPLLLGGNMDCPAVEWGAIASVLRAFNLELLDSISNDPITLASFYYQFEQLSQIWEQAPETPPWRPEFLTAASIQLCLEQQLGDDDLGGVPPLRAVESLGQIDDLGYIGSIHRLKAICC